MTTTSNGSPPLLLTSRQVLHAQRPRTSCENSVCWTSARAFGSGLRRGSMACSYGFPETQGYTSFYYCVYEAIHTIHRVVAADAGGQPHRAAVSIHPLVPTNCDDLLACLFWIGDRIHNAVGWRTKSFRRQDDVLDRR